MALPVTEGTDELSKQPISSNRLVEARDFKGELLRTEDTTRHLGGYLSLPDETPDNSNVVVIYDKINGERDLDQFIIKQHRDDGIIMQRYENAPVRGLINEMIPTTRNGSHNPHFPTVGENLSFNETSDQIFGVVLNLPVKQLITGGVIVVLSPRMLQNYRKHLTFAIK